MTTHPVKTSTSKTMAVRTMTAIVGRQAAIAPVITPPTARTEKAPRAHDVQQPRMSAGVRRLVAQKSAGRGRRGIRGSESCTAEWERPPPVERTPVGRQNRSRSALDRAEARLTGRIYLGEIDPSASFHGDQASPRRGS